MQCSGIILKATTDLYSGWLLHPIWYLNFGYATAHKKLSAEYLNSQPRVWVWICKLVLKSSAEVLGIRYPTEIYNVEEN